jgi:hypothetical protein
MDAARRGCEIPAANRRSACRTEKSIATRQGFEPWSHSLGKSILTPELPRQDLACLGDLLIQCSPTGKRYHRYNNQASYVGPPLSTLHFAIMALFQPLRNKDNTVGDIGIPHLPLGGLDEE